MVIHNLKIQISNISWSPQVKCLHRNTAHCIVQCQRAFLHTCLTFVYYISHLLCLTRYYDPLQGRHNISAV